MENQTASNAETQSPEVEQQNTLFTTDQPDARPEPSITQATLTVEQPEVQTAQGSEVAEAQTEEEALGKDDPQRMAYWQSQADRAKNDNARMAQELDMYKTALAQQPQQQSLSNEIPQQPQDDSLKEPTPPEKPLNYNEVDAYNDPESDSFKFRLQKEKYVDERYDYLKNLEYSRLQETESMMARQQEQQMVSQAYNHVRSAYNWSDQKASGFINWASDPRNVSLDVLAKLFDLTNAPSPKQVQVNQKMAEYNQQAEALKVPTTTAVQTGMANPEPNDADMFNAALLAHSKVRR
jgi:hypothetical protein